MDIMDSLYGNNAATKAAITFDFFFIFNIRVCGTVSSMLSGLKTRSLGLNTLGTT